MKVTCISACAMCIFPKGGTPRDLSSTSLITYPGNSPLSPLPPGQSLLLSAVTVTLSPGAIPAGATYTHLIINVEPVEGATSEDLVLLNNDVSIEINILEAPALGGYIYIIMPF